MAVFYKPTKYTYSKNKQCYKASPQTSPRPFINNEAAVRWIVQYINNYKKVETEFQKA